MLLRRNDKYNSARLCNYEFDETKEILSRPSEKSESQPQFKTIITSVLLLFLLLL